MGGFVVVTGASRGIGRALAGALAARGHGLVLAARSGGELEQLASELRAKHRVDCRVVAVDLGTLEGRDSLAKACEGLELMGLVNNAGFGTAGRFTELDRQRDVDMIRLNVEAVTDLCHLFVPMLKGRGVAFVANVASTAAFQPVPLFAVYSATKAFVLSFSEALAEELEPEGIAVVALCPGPTESGFQAASDVVLPPGGAPTSDEVAAWALKVIDARRRSAVHGWKNAFMAFATRLAPRSINAKAAKKTMEPWFSGRKTKAS